MDESNSDETLVPLAMLRIAWPNSGATGTMAQTLPRLAQAMVADYHRVIQSHVLAPSINREAQSVESVKNNRQAAAEFLFDLCIVKLRELRANATAHQLAVLIEQARTVEHLFPRRHQARPRLLSSGFARTLDIP